MWQWKAVLTLLFVLQVVANFFTFNQRWVEEKDVLRQISDSTITACKSNCDATPNCVAAGFEREMGAQMCYLLATSVSEKRNLSKESKTKQMFVIDNKEVLHEGSIEIINNNCPVDVNGGYGNYSEFSNCTYSCMAGVQHRNRSCVNPKPEAGGKDCSELGSPTHSKACNTIPCTCPSTHTYAYASGKYCCETNKGITDASTAQSDKCVCCSEDTSQSGCATNRSCTHNVEADFALNKPAEQSSTLITDSCKKLSKGCSASRANDGDPNTVSVTQYKKIGWWSVDMEVKVTLKKIVLILSKWGKYVNLKVETRLTKGDEWKLCRHIKNPSIGVTSFPVRKQHAC